MEKYKTIILIEKIRKCLEEGRPQEALAIAEGIDKKKLKNMSDLSVVAESYFQNVKYEEAKNLYIRIYQKTPSRRIVAQLVHLSIKLNDIEESKRYLKEFIKIAPKDFYQYIFRYSIDKMTKAPLVQLIEDLVELKHAEYIESWAYELAKLYHKAGMKDECLAECDDIILWFGSGEYVERAKALRAYYRGEIQIDEEDIVTNTEEAKAIFEDDKKEDIVTTVENFKNYTESNLHSNNYDNTEDVSEEVLEVENEECIHENMEINLEGDPERYFDGDPERDFEGDLEGDPERDFDKNLKKDIEEADIEDKDVEENDFNIISNFDDEDFSNLENNLAEQLELSFQEKEKLTEKEVETEAADNMVSELDDNLISEIENEFGVNLQDELSEDLQDGLSEDLHDELSEELQDGPKDELQDEVNEELQDVTNPVYEEDTDSSDVRPSDVAAAHALQNTEIEREVKAEIKRLLKEVDFNELAATMELATKDEALDEVKDETKEVTKEVTKDVAKDETNDVTIETQEAKNHLSKKQKKINLETLANEQLIGEVEEDLLVQLTKNQVSLIDIFGNFMRMEAVRKQLISSMDQILNQRSKNVIITGESQSGKTRLAKSYAKWLHRMQLIQSTKIALVNAEKLNHMNLLARKEQLKDCVIIIENAGVIAKETMKALLELSELYQDNIAIILEDSRENMNHLLRGNSQLNTIFNNRVHLHKYTLEDFMGFAYEYITEHDYEIEMDAFIELQNEFSVIMQKQRENTLQAIFSLLKDIIKKSEKRSSEQLKELSHTGHFADTELMVIKKVDIKS